MFGDTKTIRPFALKGHLSIALSETRDESMCFITWLTFVLCCRYVMAAQALIGDARGTLNEKGWRRTNGELASYDDISAFVIPISECSSEMAKFTVEYDKPTLKPTHSIDNEEDWAV